jgi:hypothetical protein
VLNWRRCQADATSASIAEVMCGGESSLENEIGDVEAEAMCGGAAFSAEARYCCHV